MSTNELTKALEGIKEVESIEEYPHRYKINIKPYKKDKGKFFIEVSLVYTNPKNKNSLPYLWYKKGYTKEVINNYINADTYYTDEQNYSYRYYNPCTKKVNDKTVIDFDYILPIDEFSIEKIVVDAIDMYHNNIKTK